MKLWLMMGGITLGGIIAVSALGEFALRQAVLRSAVIPCHESSPNIDQGYRLTANCADHTAEGRRELAVQPPGRPIDVLGDSVSYGPNVPVAETWPMRLAHELARRGHPQPVHNYAVQGYGAIEEAATLELVTDTPRLVLVQTCFNDAGDDMTFRHILVPGLWATTWAAHRLADPSPDRLTEGWGRLARSASEYGAPLLLLGFPHAYGARADRAGHPLPELAAYPNGWVFDPGILPVRAAELGVPWIDFLPLLAAARVRDPGHRIFTDGCCHLSSHGHKVMAEIVVEELARRGLLG